MSSDLPPLPISGTVSIGTGLWTITFDRLLLPGVLFSPNWVGIANLGMGSKTWSPAVGPVVAGSAVTFTGLQTGPSFGADRVSYAATPADLKAITGVPVAPFVDFAVTVIP